MLLKILHENKIVNCVSLIFTIMLFCLLLTPFIHILFELFVLRYFVNKMWCPIVRRSGKLPSFEAVWIENEHIDLAKNDNFV